MGLLSREELLGASDIVEREIELPSIKGSVRIRSLPAAYSNLAQSEALEMDTDNRGRQTARVNMVKLECLQVLHGLVDPKLGSLADVEALSQKIGPAWRDIVNGIDEISGINKEEIEAANARFQPSGAIDPGQVVGAAVADGNGQPDLPAPASA